MSTRRTTGQSRRRDDDDDSATATSQRGRRGTDDQQQRRRTTDADSPEIITVRELAQFDEVIPLIRDALKDVRLDDNVKPGELQKRILKAVDDDKLELVKDVDSVNRILSNAILDLQRSPDIGTGDRKDQILRNAMRRFVSTIRQRAEEIESQSQTFSVVKKRAEVLGRERDELAESLKTQRVTATQLESDKKDLTRQLEQRQNELGQLRRENETLRSQEEGRERQILQRAEQEKKDFEARLEGQLNQFEEDLRRARQEIAEEEEKLRRSEAQVRQLQQERDTAVRALEASDRELQRAKQDLTQEKKTAESAERDCRALEQRVRSLEDRLETTEGERDRLRGRVQDLQTSLSGDEKQLVRDSAEAKALADQVAELTKELRTLEAECAKSTDTIETLQDQLRDRDRQLGRMKEDDVQEKERLAELERRDAQRREELARARAQLEDVQEDVRERARKPTPVPEEGKQWKYRVQTLETCVLGKNECSHPNRKLIRSAVYDDKTAPPSISLVIDTYDKQTRKSIETRSLTVGFKDETEKKDESPVAFTFTPSDNKPILGTELRVKITPAPRGQKTSIDFVGYDIFMSLDKATFDPLFANAQGKAPTISVVLQHETKKVFRDTTSPIITRWTPGEVSTQQQQQQAALADEATAARRRQQLREEGRRQPQQQRRDDERERLRQQEEEEEIAPVAREPPRGSLKFTEDRSTTPLRVGEEQLSYGIKVPTFPGDSQRRLDTLSLTLAEQQSPKRVLTTVCDSGKEGIELLDSTLFSLSDSGASGLRQGTTVNVSVFPYDPTKTRSRRATTIEYDPAVGTFDANRDDTLNIRVYLCEASRVTKFNPNDAYYILTVQGESSRPTRQPVFIEKVTPRAVKTSITDTRRRTSDEPVVVTRTVREGRREVPVLDQQAARTQQRQEFSRVPTSQPTAATQQRQQFSRVPTSTQQQQQQQQRRQPAASSAGRRSSRARATTAATTAGTRGSSTTRIGASIFRGSDMNDGNL